MNYPELRKALKGFKVRDIASETRLSKQTIYTFLGDEASKPTPATLKLLSDWLGMATKREAAKARVRAK